MKIRHLLYTACIGSLIYFITLTGTGCAQIGAPTGGPRDSLPPVLVNASPELESTNFDGNRITLVFDEYIEVKDIQNNVLVSPFPKTNPQIDFKLKTVTVKLKDTLLANTTYAINFGNAIVDNNEGNPFKNFTYVFSTGPTIDSLEAAGNVILAETGKTDSTIVAMLYCNVDDSAVQKRKPDYIAKLDGEGKFRFTNLSAGRYKLYALKDGDGGRTYNSKIEQFGFLDNDIEVADSTKAVTLYAYAEEKDQRQAGTTTAPARVNAQAEKRLRYTSNIEDNFQDLLSDLVVTANKPLKVLDTSRIVLTDTNYNKIAASITLDSTARNIIVKTTWQEETQYRLLLDKEAISDSAGTQLTKTDTIRFTTKKQADYGNLVLRFSNLKVELHPVLQFIKGEDIYRSVPVTSQQWSDKMFVPGDYELRILYDSNNNGKWDPGDYSKKLQPERAVTLDTKLLIKANWDNEREVKLL